MFKFLSGWNIFKWKWGKLLKLRKDRATQVELLISCESFLGKDVVRAKIMDKSQKQMVKEASRIAKNGEKPTVEKLTQTLREEPKFLAYCVELGLDMTFFEGLVEGAIAGVKQ